MGSRKAWPIVGGFVLAVAAAVFALGRIGTAESSSTLEPDKVPDKLARATFGAGCFWCTEAVFQQLKGVQSVVSGYSGGSVKNPTYRQICTGTTGHAEAIQVTYDPAVISYEDLLEVFWKTHDPTTRDRQGNDVGSQYRSVIFYHGDEQRRIAEETIRDLQAEQLWPRLHQEVPSQAMLELPLPQAETLHTLREARDRALAALLRAERAERKGSLSPPS